VHKAGSKIFLQIFHGGRSAALNTSKDGQLWAPSAIAIRDFNSKLQKNYPVPK
jgi:2,4-dienoyl-CoA reductase-like NADH-dependent reductase (Old Yellow Enzyme family)